MLLGNLKCMINNKVKIITAISRFLVECREDTYHAILYNVYIVPLVMMRWSSSDIAVEVKAPTDDQAVASMREDLPALPQHAGVGVEPTLDIESEG